MVVKTTVELNDALYRAAKKMAVDRGTSLREMIEAGLRREMERPGRAGRRRIPQPGEWPQAPAPLDLPADVNLADRTSLWAWIERDRGRR